MKWVAAAAVLLVAAGCGSSSNHATASSTTSGTASSESSVTTSSGSGHAYTLGVLVDLTGPGSTNSLKFPQGVKAGVALAESEGYKINYVVADTATSPTQALAAAQKLVEQDHVFAVLALSAITFSAEPFLASKGIPVIGANVDGPEWATQRNMFSVSGTADYTKVFTQRGPGIQAAGCHQPGRGWLRRLSQLLGDS